MITFESICNAYDLDPKMVREILENNQEYRISLVPTMGTIHKKPIKTEQIEAFLNWILATLSEETKRKLTREILNEFLCDDCSRNIDKIIEK